MAMLALCLLWILVTAARPVLAAPTGGPEPARYEELTVLFHGALQLSQALNNMYRATEAQLMEAGQSLSLCGQVLRHLGQEVSQGQATAQELHTSLLEIQAEENVLQLQAEAMMQVLGEVAQLQQKLRERVQWLEVRVRGARLRHVHHELEALKVRADKQSHIVWTLVGHVQRQKREMAAQQRRLQKIQQRLHTAALPA